MEGVSQRDHMVEGRGGHDIKDKRTVRHTLYFGIVDSTPNM